MMKTGKKENEMNWAGSNRWQCRVAPSLGGGFAGTPNEVWGTVDYEDDELPTVFFGMYGLPDFYTFWRHKGRKAILWAGSDIRHFRDGYWLDEVGNIRLVPSPMAEYIRDNATSYVENQVEQDALMKCGIPSIVVPSFLGDVEDYILQLPSEGLSYYSSVSGDDYALYGWDKILDMAAEHPDVEFHLYGNIGPFNGTDNVWVHGRVPQEIMNQEVKRMTGAIRMTEFDGFSEILAKSVLWGQHPISLIDYPFMDKEPTKHDHPNIKGRDHYLRQLNKYPWNAKTN